MKKLIEKVLRALPSKCTNIFVVGLALLFACQKDCELDRKRIANAKVVASAEDCGPSYLIRLLDTGDGTIPSNETGNVFYEINLPDAFKVVGAELFVQYRLPNEDELLSCKTLHSVYPQLFITAAE